MVKVKEEPAMAEPNPAATTSQQLPSLSPNSSVPTAGRKPPRPPHNHSHLHHHHLYHPPFQHFPIYHHQCAYNSDGEAAAAAAGNGASGVSSPAKFIFGPGFEPQQQIPGVFNINYAPVSGQSQGTEYVVFFHVNPGVTISFQMGDNLEILRGPVTVPMVSTNSSPPIAMPVQVPPGHVVQQIVDESGTLRHVILSPQHPPPNLVPLPSHNPQHYGGGPGNGTNQAQQYYPGPMAGYPPQHFHSNIQPGHPVPSPTHLGHSPPPNPSYYKDERTQRQHIKLKKKLQDKQQKSDVVGLLPRKELVNGLKRSAIKDKGMNSVGTSEDGEESSVPDEEDSFQIVTEILSSVQAPKVSDLSSRSALLQWAPPVRLSESASNDSHDLDISESDLRYEVLLSDKSKEMKFKSIYSGSSLTCRIQDLKPGQEYSVCLQVHLDELQGSASDPVKFTTPSCEPDQPQPPKLIHRTKNSLQLRWTAVNDNGSSILNYILEYDDGKSGDYVEFYKGRGKTHTLQKLQPATAYRFRLAVTNEIGKSLYSDPITYCTFDNPPSQPSPPVLHESNVHSLHLEWIQRPKDDEFTLQMNDPKTKYGHMTVYNGRNNFHVCQGLTYFSNYTFRLRTRNDDGTSPWSEEVTYQTLPDRPSRPSKPVVKGKIHAHSFKLKWEPPSDTGGAEINKYILEVNSGSGYETVYTGIETESVCDKLTPGTTYQLRVSCLSAGGASNYSDPCTVTTDAISPGQCPTPRLQGKPKANSVSVRWAEPDYNGGAPVLDYEVEMESVADSSRSVVHKSKERECSVVGLSPGSEYIFTVRSVNRIGPGPWSEPLKITSGAAPPAAPEIPSVHCKSAFHVYAEWRESPCNGAAITEYRLEMNLESDEPDSQFQCVYQGPHLNYDVKGLNAFQTYFFRVQAGNCAGFSPYSPVAATITPAAPPSAVTSLRSYPTPTSITLQWNPPADNGSAITHYNIDLGDGKTISTEETVNEFELENLQPDTIHRIKIQAVNGVAAGPYSSTLKTSTLRLPPVAPKLDCVGVGHNYLKLKWGEGKNTDYVQYCVEIENPKSQCVYKGTALSCKVNKLSELTTYRLRINASNDAGVGDFSETYEFTTTISPPTILKVPKIVELDQRSCSLEWMPSKNTFSDPIEYQVQLARTKEQAFSQVYRGQETKCSLDHLEPGVDYSARICPVRITSTAELLGPYSTILNFTTLAAEPTLSSKQLSSLNAASHQSRTRPFYHSLWQMMVPHKQFPDEYRTYVYVILVMLLGIFISLGIASFL